MDVLLCPLSDPGFLYPGIAVGRELRGRGHSVHLLAKSRMASVAACGGLPLLPAECYGDPRAFSVASWTLNMPAQYDATLRAAREVKPDALVTSVLCMGVLLAAETLQLPVTVIGLAAHLWAYRSRAEDERESVSHRDWRGEALTGFYQQAREQVGMPGRGPMRPLTGNALLLRGDPVFEFPGTALPDRVHHVGPCWWEPPADPGELDLVLAHVEYTGKPVVYVHVGRTFGGRSLWPQLNAIFTDGPFQAVVEQGRSSDAEPDPAADIVLVRQPWMAPLIDRSELVLTSGTTAPVLGTLLRGRPLAVSPAGSEQPLLAAACVRAGVAAYLARDPGENGTPTLRRIWENTTVRRNAQELGHKLAATDSARRAAVLIEQVTLQSCGSPNSCNSRQRRRSIELLPRCWPSGRFLAED